MVTGLEYIIIVMDCHPIMIEDMLVSYTVLYVFPDALPNRIYQGYVTLLATQRAIQHVIQHVIRHVTPHVTLHATRPVCRVVPDNEQAQSMQSIRSIQ